MATYDRRSRPKARSPQGMLGAVDIPWTDDFRLDENSFRRLLKRLKGHGFGRLYVMGTAGEGYAMSDALFRDVVDVFVEEMRGPGLVPQVGAISLSTQQVIERVRYAHGKGVRSFQISLPSWGPVSDSEMLTFFRVVCGSFPDSEFLHYNLVRTKRVLTGDDYRKIVDLIPNLTSTKQSTYDMGLIRGWMLRAPELQHFFLQHSFAYGSLFGECSLLCSMAGLFPKLTREYFEAGRTGDAARAFELQRTFIDVGESLYGSAKSAHMDGAYDKLLVWLTDPSFPRRLLPPYETFSDEDATRARQAYEARWKALG
ncbi:MAG: dihydrodipicolinate synthase family protein [SAR202 cluster bacterium]|nr:dihydrodipicolinate synthase family protein [SAR202 cluster bacterium]